MNTHIGISEIKARQMLTSPTGSANGTALSVTVRCPNHDTPWGEN